MDFFIKILMENNYHNHKKILNSFNFCFLFFVFVFVLIVKNIKVVNKMFVVVMTFPLKIQGAFLLLFLLLWTLQRVRNILLLPYRNNEADGGEEK